MAYFNKLTPTNSRSCFTCDAFCIIVNTINCVECPVWGARLYGTDGVEYLNEKLSFQLFTTLFPVVVTKRFDILDDCLIQRTCPAERRYMYRVYTEYKTPAVRIIDMNLFI